MKKSVILFLCGLFCAGSMYSQQSGEDGPITWEIVDSVLIIRGEGAMPDYDQLYFAPWLFFENEIVKVEICEGVTHIGNCAFDHNYSELTSIIIPASVKTIGTSSAFVGCNNLTELINASLEPQPAISTMLLGIFFQFCTLRVPDVSIESYKVAGGWDSFIPENVVAIDAEISLSSEHQSIQEGLGVSILATVTGDVANSEIISWTSSNKNIVSVEKNGAIKAISPGWAVITASIGSIEATSTVFVFPGATEQFTWDIRNDVLIITGNGPMPEYINNDLRPWYEQREMITSVVIGEGVTSICKGAFHSCHNITSVYIPPTVTMIGEDAFRLCYRLTSVTIPSSVIYIGNGLLSGCSELTSISVDGTNQYYSSEDDVLFNKDKTTLLAFPAGKSGSYIIPETVNTIGDFSFQTCKLTSVVIPHSVLYIGKSSFYRSSITSLSLPASIISIGDNALSGCSAMTSISVDAANPEYSSKDGVLFNKDATTLVVFPSGIWGDYTIPESVDTIAFSAFWESKLSSVTIPHSVLSIGTMAFRLNGNLTSITIPSSVKSIGYCAFLDSGLTSVVIPASVIDIDAGVFEGCNNISKIVNNSPTPQILPIDINHGVFPDVIFSSCILHVPSASVDSYRNAEIWKMFHNIKAIEEELTIDKKELYLLTGATAVITVTVSDELNPNDIVWNSNQPEVATVDNNGIVKAIQVGTTVITASFGTNQARCTVTVIERGKSIIEGTITNGNSGNTRVNLFINTEESGSLKRGILGGYVLLATTIPNDNGEYRFDNLPEGYYQVQVVMDDFAPEASDLLLIPENEILTDIDFVVDEVAGKIIAIADLTTGAEELINTDASVIICPNPFTDVVRISGVALVETAHASSLQVRIINTAGAMVHTQTITNPDVTIHLGHLPAGMYIIRLESSSMVKTLKTIKIQ